MLEKVALETSRRKLPETVPFGIGTLFATELLDLKVGPGGILQPR